MVVFLKRRTIQVVFACSYDLHCHHPQKVRKQNMYALALSCNKVFLFSSHTVAAFGRVLSFERSYYVCWYFILEEFLTVDISMRIASSLMDHYLIAKSPVVLRVKCCKHRLERTISDIEGADVSVYT